MRRLAFLFVLVLAVARPTSAQSSASLHLGLFVNEDGGREESFPAWALRGDRALNRWLLVEAEGQYVPVQLVRFQSATVSDRSPAPRFMANAQGQLQLPLGRARPYAAVGAGIFTYERLAESEARSRPRVVGSTRFMSLGLRVDLGRTLGARAELRVRRDRPSFGYFAVDVEPSLGVSWRW